MPTESRETQATPETIESLRKRIEELERKNKELEEKNKELEEKNAELTSKANQGNLREEIAVNKLYGFGKLRLNKAEVDNTLKNLKGEHKTKIEDFIKNNEIEDLQKYLNGLIDSGIINKDQLVNRCREKGVWLRDGRIYEDGKFGPQTFEAIKSLSSVSGGGSEDGDRDNENDGTKDRGNGSGEKPKEYTIEKVGNKNCKIEQINSISDLPEGYKWDDPENYDASKQDTYPTIYRTVDYKYIFYSNGRCKTPEGMKNTKDVVENLRRFQSDNEAPIPQDNQVEFSGELPNGIAKELVEYVNDNLANELVMGNNEKLEINWGYPNWANLSLLTGLPSDAYASVQYSINLKKCINNDGSIATDYIKNTLLPIAKDNLKQQKKAVLAVKGNLLRGKEYSMDDIFGDDEEVKNDLVLKTKLENYFKIFEDKKVTFDLGNYDDDTKFDNGNIKLTLDNDDSNKDYNKWRNNPDILIFPAKDIIDDDYTLNETKFKEKLKGIIRAIAEKENVS